MFKQPRTKSNIFVPTPLGNRKRPDVLPAGAPLRCGVDLHVGDEVMMQVDRQSGRCMPCGKVAERRRRAFGSGTGARAAADRDLGIDGQQTLVALGLVTSLVAASLKVMVCALAGAKISRGKCAPTPIATPSLAPERAACF